MKVQGKIRRDISPTFFGTLDDFGDFIIEAFRKLPRPLVERIHEIRLTKPASGVAFDHWYASDSRMETIQPDDIGKRLAELRPKEQRTVFVEDETTPMWGPIDLRRHMQGAQLGKHAKHLLRLALDAHNLADRAERYSGTQPPWVKRAWCDDGGPIFDANWSQKHAPVLSPQDRLTLALRRYTSGRAGAWPGSGSIALDLSYRAKDPSAYRFYSRLPYVVPG
jgi:hypothetical protein